MSLLEKWHAMRTRTTVPTDPSGMVGDVTRTCSRPRILRRGASYSRAIGSSIRELYDQPCVTPIGGPMPVGTSPTRRLGTRSPRPERKELMQLLGLRAADLESLNIRPAEHRTIQE